jgi:hypothetical protein
MKIGGLLLMLMTLLMQPVHGVLIVENFSLNALPPVTANPNLKILSFEVNEKAVIDSESNDILTIIENQDNFDVNALPEVIGKPYNFPNPFRLNSGTSLGYELSKPLNIELKIYNSTGHLMFSKMYTEWTNGGKAGYNQVDLSAELASFPSLSAGIYFFFILNEGVILGKGKMAITP